MKLIAASISLILLATSAAAPGGNALCHPSAEWPDGPVLSRGVAYRMPSTQTIVAEITTVPFTTQIISFPEGEECDGDQVFVVPEGVEPGLYEFRCTLIACCGADTRIPSTFFWVE